jgi:hypothetical protein
MGKTEEVGFVDRKGPKKAETKNQKVDCLYKSYFSNWLCWYTPIIPTT